MILFPMTKANVGLSITRDSLCLATVKRGLGGIRCRHIAEQQLPPDMLRLSPTKLNISNQPEFSDCLRTLLKGVKQPQPVALSLPDLCGRTAILTFSNFPSKKTEQDSIVQWRFQQDMNLPTDKARFSYCVFPPPPKQPGPTHVLATAIQRDIIEQYEQVCLECGLLPHSAGLAGLDVFDFYRSQVLEFSRGSQSRSHDLSQECLFLYLADWGFSFIAFRQGYPVFARVKALPIPRPQSGDSVESHASSRLTIMDTVDVRSASQYVQDQYLPTNVTNVANELVATLQYYFETLQPPRVEAESIPLYFAEGLRQAKTLLPEETRIQEMLKSSLSHPPNLTMATFTDNLSPKIKKVMLNSTPQMASMSAVASVMVLS